MHRRQLLVATAAMLPAVRAARAEALDEIKARGELIVGMEAAYRPFEFFQDGKIIGYDVDLAETLAATLGVKARLVDTAWNGIIAALYARKFDLIMSGMVITRERAERVQFSMPYADSSTVLLIRAGDASITGPKDLNGKVVATQIASSMEPEVKAVDSQLKAAGGRGVAKLKRVFDHMTEAYADLAQGRTQAVFVGRIPAMALIASQPGRFAITGLTGDRPVYAGIAMRKEDTGLFAAVNGLLAASKKDGSLEALQVKWLGGVSPTPDVLLPADL